MSAEASPPSPAEKLARIHACDSPVESLLEIMRILRDPQGGCAWDVEQTLESLTKHTIEEAYEVADAVERCDIADLKDELGDLLLQVVFYAQIAEEDGLFSFNEIIEHVVEKLIVRHPHVFADTEARSAGDVVDVWEGQKEKLKPRESALDGVTLGLPALMRAQKLQKRAARIGFEWPDVSGAIEKFKEEMAEFEDAMAENDPAHLRDEFSDVMFTLINIGRMMGYDVEECTREANDKFESRFRGMESKLKVHYSDLKAVRLDEMEKVWQEIKTKPTG